MTTITTMFTQEECKIDCGAECALLCEIFFSCAAPGGEVTSMRRKMMVLIMMMVLIKVTTIMMHIISRVTWWPILRRRGCEN